LPNTRTGNHIAGQLLKSGTSPYPSHGETQAAESPKDFVHKLRISLKKLRETQRWLKLIQKVPLVKKSELLNDMLDETEELIKIFLQVSKRLKRKRNSYSRFDIEFLRQMKLNCGAKRHHYSMFNVGRSMFDVQPVPCSTFNVQCWTFIF